MTKQVAVSLALADTESCLATLASLAPSIAMAEIRLDLMESFHLPQLIAEAPCPLIVTCRPPREGGRFYGSETQRLAILQQAMACDCAYIDVEWDSVATLADRHRSMTRVIVSRHWFDSMPPHLWAAYQELRGRADVVKLVGTAQCPLDTLPVFDLLSRAESPIIAIAMGAAGQLTRLLAPCFASCLLTYAAPSAAAATASGQLTVDEMIQVYRLDQVNPRTNVCMHLCVSEASAARVSKQNSEATAGAVLYVPLILTPAEAADVVVELRGCFPRLTITADPPLTSRYLVSSQ